MPLYVFQTEETVSHQHPMDIELPVDMGDSNDRLTDRMARTVAENRALDGLTENEKVTAVYRGNERIWPRNKKRQGTPKAVLDAIDDINRNIAAVEAEEDE